MPRLILSYIILTALPVAIPAGLLIAELLRAGG